jgi:serine/threonine protein kinase/WD40 repeat protein/tetratricopeptide (TPR) repeat protein
MSLDHPSEKNSGSPEDPREERLAEILAACSDRISAGDHLDVEAILREHPDLAEDLRTPLETMAGVASAFGETKPFEALGEYTIIREVGRGGMGVVYEARQRSLGRRVALKVIRSGLLQDRRAMERFKHEATIASRLDHPGICTVYEAAVDGDTPYIAMRYIDGETISTRISTRFGRSEAASRRTASVREASSPSPPAAAQDAAPPSPPDCKEIFGYTEMIERAARALHVAHEAGFVHRDIKPGNIMVDREGQPVILDFGLARDEMAGTHGLTATGDQLGTPAYMSPEQVSSARFPVDRRTDVYSLGVTLYECVTGTLPFDAPTREVLYRQILEVDPPDPRRRNPAVPKDLAIILQTVLEKDLARRYATALDFAEDLRRARSNEPIRARSLNAAQRAWRWCRRRPAVAALGASVFLLLVAIAVGSLLAAASMREKLWSAYLAHAQASRWSGRPGQRFDGLEALERAARIRPTMELRNEAISCMALVDVRTLSSAETNDWPVFDLTLERYTLHGSGRKDIRIYGTADGREILRLETSLPVEPYTVKFSPDGRRAAAQLRDANGDILQVWDLARREVILSTDPGVKDFDFGPDGRLVAAAGHGKRIDLHDLEKRTPVRSISVGRRVKLIGFHPGGAKAAILYEDSGIDIISLPGGQVEKSLTTEFLPFTMVWSPDGRFLAYGSFMAVEVMDFFLDKQKPSLRGHEGWVVGLDFSRRSDLLASSSWDGTWRLWDPFSGRQLLVSTGEVRPFGLDDRRLAAWEGQSKIGILEVVHAEEYRSVPVIGKTLWVDFLPDTRLAAISTDKAISLWDLGSFRELAAIPVDGCEAFFLGGDELVTFHRFGLFRFPIHRSPEDPGLLRIGPPSLVDKESSLNGPSPARMGKRVAFVDQSTTRGVVLDLRSRIRRTRLGIHPQIWSIAMSADGELVATGTWHGHGVRVWQASSGNLALELPEEGSANVQFSPDGLHLVVGKEKAHIAYDVRARQRVRTWARSPGAPGFCAFTASGSLMAIATTHTRVELIDPSTWSSLAALDPGGSTTVERLFFSGDDGRLLECAPFGGPIHIWDVRMIRSGLSSMGLDWDGPAIGPEDPRPLRIEVDLGRLDDFLRYQDELGRGISLRDKGDDPGAIAALREALRIRPDGTRARTALAGLYAKQGDLDGADVQLAEAWRIDPDVEVPAFVVEALLAKGKDQERAVSLLRKILDRQPQEGEVENQIARFLTFGPKEVRDPARALPFAEKAAASPPDTSDGIRREALGITYFRLGRYEDALRSLRHPHGEGTADKACLVVDLLFIAMIQERLGRKDEARGSYREAIDLMKKLPDPCPLAKNMKEFQAEAEEVLGIQPAPDSDRKDR